MSIVEKNVLNVSFSIEVEPRPKGISCAHWGKNPTTLVMKYKKSSYHQVKFIDYDSEIGLVML